MMQVLRRSTTGQIDWWGTFVYVAVFGAFIYAVNDVTGVVRTPGEKRIERRIIERVIIQPEVRFPNSDHVIFRTVVPRAPTGGLAPGGKATPRRGGTTTTQRPRRHAKKPKKAKTPAAIFQPLAPVVVPPVVPVHGQQFAPGQTKPKPQKQHEKRQTKTAASPSSSDETQNHKGPEESQAGKNQEPAAKDAKIVTAEQPTSPSEASSTPYGDHPDKPDKDESRRP